MKAYIDIVNRVLTHGVRESNRTGVDALTVTGCMFEHDMRDGFPLLTTKKVPFRLVASELEFFVKGLTDKWWLKVRNNHIWDEWCSPERVPYGHDEETRARMESEPELGPIYGWQWRNFGAGYLASYLAPEGEGVDQLRRLVRTLKHDPRSRRMLVTAWNPVDIGRMALPPCHYGFQVTVTEGRLNLLWSQRSVDVALGLPFNIASYGLLLHLLAKEVGLNVGKLVGFLADTHIYDTHIHGIREQILREPRQLPHVATDRFGSIFDWQYTDTEVVGYDPHATVKFDICV